MICHKSDEKSLNYVIETLKLKKVVIIPTDTVYGFSGIVDDEVCKKIQNIKGRGEDKPFIQLIARPEDVFKYTDEAIPEKLLNMWPGPLTIIVKDSRLIGHKIETSAFRCPGDIWLRKILENISVPVYSTSVNRSGFPVLDTENDIVSQFSDDADLIVLDGNKKNALPSTIVSCTKGEVKVLRQGSLVVD